MSGIEVDLATAEVSLLYVAHNGWVVKIANSQIKTLHLEQEDVDYVEKVIYDLITHLQACPHKPTEKAD